MKRREDSELLGRRLAFKIRECRYALLALQNAISKYEEPQASTGQVQLSATIEASAASHVGADKIFELLLMWKEEGELEEQFGYSRLSAEARQARFHGTALASSTVVDEVSRVEPHAASMEGGQQAATHTVSEKPVAHAYQPGDNTQQPSVYVNATTTTEVCNTLFNDSVHIAVDPFSAGVNKPAVRLPKLNLPTFSGKYLEFITFWQAFKISVLSQNIPNSSKFAYLNSLLSGDAAQAVRGIAMTDEGFEEACRILKERFGDTNELIFKHLHELLKLEPPKAVSSGDTGKLWDFYNCVQSHVRSLAFLGINSSRFGIVITPIIVSRLPSQLALEWAETSKGKEGDLQNLLTFLQDTVNVRQRALCFSTDSSSMLSGASTQDNNTSQSRQPRLATTSALTVSKQDSLGSSSLERCLTCGKAHNLVSCEQFLNSTVAKRRQAIYNYGACYKCFGANHLAKNCPTRIKCHHCDAPHHPLLCKLGGEEHINEEQNVFYGSHTKSNGKPSFGAPRNLRLTRGRINRSVAESGVPSNYDTNNVSKGSATIHTVLNPLTSPSPVLSAAAPHEPQLVQGFSSYPNANYFPINNEEQLVSLEQNNFNSGDTQDQFPGFIGLTTHSPKTIVLQTVSIPLKTKCGSIENFNILFDSGSDRSFITNAAVSKLEVNIIDVQNLAYGSFGNSTVTQSGLHNLYEVNLLTSLSVRCLGVDTISSNIRKPVLSDEVMRELGSLNLKYQNAGEGIEIHMLIGLNNYWDIIQPEFIKLQCGFVAQNSKLGYIVSGACLSEFSNKENVVHNPPSVLCCISSSLPVTRDSAKKSVHDFWSLESIGIDAPVSAMMGSVRNALPAFFTKSINYADKRYSVALPWRSDEAKYNLLSNFYSATVRFNSLKRRLSRDQSLSNQYHSVFVELRCLDIIREINLETQINKFPVFYLPHHPVIRESSITTKVRPVFDASATGSNDISLNDCMNAGPNLLPLLTEVLLRFRRWRYAYTADITKAFLQVGIQESDQDVHRFLWDDKGVTRIMKFTRVPFGNSASPFLLNATIKFHLSKYDKEDPTVIELSNNLYVDDWLSGCDSVEQSRGHIQKANDIMALASMHFTKWASNCTNLATNTTYEFDSKINVQEDQKILGLKWDPRTDSFLVNCGPLTVLVKLTKRIALSLISKIFDPLGFLNPFLIRAKILFQSLWAYNLEWDSPLPLYESNRIKDWLSEVEKLKDFSTPRQFFPEIHWKDIVELELHVFCDASPLAYGTVIYMRGFLANNKNPLVSYVISKARVAPVKTETLPRLELTACVLGCRMAKFVINALARKDIKSYFWTDSKICLGWIKQGPHKCKTYVSNRVKEITEFMSTEFWQYCPTHKNPADLVTRGLPVMEFLREQVWIRGPDELSGVKVSFIESTESEILDREARVLVTNSIERVDRSYIACLNSDTSQDREEGLVNKSFVVLIPNLVGREPLFLNRLAELSSFKKMVRVVAWVLRAISIFRGHTFNQVPLDLKELSRSKILLYALLQCRHFSEEINCIKRGVSLPKNSSLSGLHPFIDSQMGVLRMSSRLGLSELPYDQQYPIILPRCIHVVALIREVHLANKHSGVGLTVLIIREHLWIPGLKRLTAKLKKSCISCQRYDSRTQDAPEPPLPVDRVKLTAPFNVVGIDHAGPLYTSDNGKSKFYVLLFTCAVVRAVHLELVGSLTAQDTILAFRRFVARRGTPEIVYSDNSKTFQALSRHLAEKLLFCKPIWKFITPRAPWVGGWWERLIQSVKKALRKTLGSHSVSLIELTTLFTEIEHCINSRPLTYISDGPEYQVITPEGFLIAKAAVTIDQASQIHPYQSLSQIQGKILDRFWQLWKGDYLLTLPSNRSKDQSYQNIKKGQVVLVREDFDKRAAWPLGLVVDVRPSADGIVRSATIKIGLKTYERPIQRLFELEVCDQGQSTSKLLQLPDFEDNIIENNELESDLSDQDLSDSLEGEVGVHEFNEEEEREPQHYRTKYGRAVKTPQRMDL